jgi:hypothetical protein
MIVDSEVEDNELYLVLSHCLQVSVGSDHSTAGQLRDRIASYITLQSAQGMLGGEERVFHHSSGLFIGSNKREYVYISFVSASENFPRVLVKTCVFLCLILSFIWRY